MLWKRVARGAPRSKGRAERVVYLSACPESSGHIGVYFSIDVMRRFLSGRYLSVSHAAFPPPRLSRMRLGDFSEIEYKLGKASKRAGIKTPIRQKFPRVKFFREKPPLFSEWYLFPTAVSPTRSVPLLVSDGTNFFFSRGRIWVGYAI